MKADFVIICHFKKGNKNLLGYHFSEESKRKISEGNKGEKSGKWKGDKAGYCAIHCWVRRYKGKASKHKCKCGKQADGWSNKKHDYKRNLKDYVARCASCHKIYDIKNNLA